MAWPSNYRAIDQDGQRIDASFSKRRNANAALVVFERSIAETGVTPERVISDNATWYPPALREVAPVMRFKDQHMPVFMPHVAKSRSAVASQGAFNCIARPLDADTRVFGVGSGGHVILDPRHLHHKTWRTMTHNGARSCVPSPRSAVRQVRT